MDASIKKEPMFSRQALISLTIPIILEAVLSIMAGTVDTVMVSGLGEASVSAVSLVDSIAIILVYFFAAMTYGGVVVTAQYIGRGDTENANKSGRQLFYLSVFVSIILSFGIMPFMSAVIDFIYPGLEPIVFEYAKTYLFWILLGLPFFAMGNAACSLLRAQAISKPVMYLTVGINIVNIIGNAILIYWLDMGIMGAAISTSFSRVVYGVGGMIMIHNRSLKVHFSKILKIRLDFSMLKNIFIIGGANGLENSLFFSGKLILSSFVSSLGTVYIAAHAVSNQLCNMGWTTIGAFSSTLLTVVGQCMGAGEKEQARGYLVKIEKVATIFVLVIFGLIFLLRNQLVLLFGFDESALELSAYYTGVGALVTICSVYSWSFAPLSAFRAAGDTVYALTVSISSMFIFRVALALVLGIYFHMGLMAIWIGNFADWGFRSVVNFIHFKRGKWLLKKVI